ncbi:hypothetical protein [Gracilimonas sp. BCB1]|uniref:hypothetical protein n=1 Tax=Gracilimonas sp. BCB1 TaxID=3152362 RepID=UPI0032D8D4D3
MNKLVVPVGILQYMLSDYRTRGPVFELYLNLKFYYGPFFKIEAKDIRFLQRTLGYKSKRSITNNLNNLLEINWLGFDSNRELYAQRGVDYLCSVARVEYRVSVELWHQDLKTVKAFCAGACIGLLSYKNFTNRKNNPQERFIKLMREGLKLRSLSQNLPLDELIPSKALKLNREKYWPVASKSVASCLGISISNARSLKQLAAEYSYIFLESLEVVLDEESNQIALHQKYGSPNSEALRAKSGKVCIDLPDLVKAGIRYRSRKHGNFKTH